MLQPRLPGIVVYDVYDRLLMHFRRYRLGDLRRLVERAGLRVVFASHLGTLLYPGFRFVKRRNRRYLAGAATNPDPEVFAYAAAQVAKILEATHRLGGENYVLWGGREGYETLLNTNMKQELDQLGRFLSLVAEHKHKIGFKGTLLIEPKPKEPTKHQYDFDTAASHSRLGLA